LAIAAQALKALIDKRYVARHQARSIALARRFISKMPANLKDLDIYGNREYTEYRSSRERNSLVRVMKFQLGLATIASFWLGLQLFTAGTAVATEKSEQFDAIATTTTETLKFSSIARAKGDEPYKPQDNGGPDSSQGSGTR
jgi:hypothetical protein